MLKKITSFLGLAVLCALCSCGLLAGDRSGLFTMPVQPSDSVRFHFNAQHRLDTITVIHQPVVSSPLK